MVTRKTAASRRSPPTHIYQLLVSLDEIEPKIWRRLWVPDILTLAKLDRVIQAAMGWTNSHLHEFAIEGHRYGIVDPEWDQEPDLLEDKRFRVGDVLGTRVQDLLYTYDFSDSWMHSAQNRADPRGKRGGQHVAHVPCRRERLPARRRRWHLRVHEIPAGHAGSDAR